MNFWIDAGRIAWACADIIAANESYGASKGRRWQSGQRRVRFGEPHGAASCRPRPSGRARRCDLALLEVTGWNVTREFYYNDAGAQIENLAASVEARLNEISRQIC